MATGYGKFWPINDRPARVLSTGGAPFALSAGQTLTVEVDGGSTQTVTLSATDFTNIAAATAVEVAYVLDRDIDGARTFVESADVYIVSETYGSASYIQVTGGTANAVLAYSTSLIQGISDGTLTAQADPQGAAIDLSWYLWTTDDGTTYWDQPGSGRGGAFKILMKKGEYPREHDDANAKVVLNTTYSLPATKAQQTLQITTLEPGVVYYFTFFAYRSDFGSWAYDEHASFAWAFPFGQWDHGLFYFRRSPEFMQRDDKDIGHWEQFCDLLGHFTDGLKTEVEELATLWDANNVRAAFIPQIDYFTGWPTNYEFPELDQRRETKLALDTWRKKGRKISITYPAEQTTDYDVQLIDGWKYVMLHNDENCTHPDTTASGVALHIGHIDDLLCYHPDLDTWHNVNGWGVFYLPIIGTSGVFTSTMITKVHRLMGVMKPSFADYSFVLEPYVGDEEPDPPDEEWYDTHIMADEIPLPPTEESATDGYPFLELLHVDTTAGTPDTTRTHNNYWIRRPHSAIDWIGDPADLLAGPFNTNPDIRLGFVRSFVTEHTSQNLDDIGVGSEAGAFGGIALRMHDVEGGVIWEGPGYVDRIVNKGTISLRVKPKYSDEYPPHPGADQIFFFACEEQGTTNSEVSIIHDTSSNLIATVRDQSGVIKAQCTYNQMFAGYDTWYTIEFDFDLYVSPVAESGYAHLFINGTKVVSDTFASTSRVSSMEYMAIGSDESASTDAQHFYLDDLRVRDDVVHITNYTPRTEADPAYPEFGPFYSPFYSRPGPPA